jgi:hypothetical protein
MTVKKNMTDEERAKRLEMLKVIDAARKYRDFLKKLQNTKPLEAPMGFFTVSEEEDKTLEHMTVRALADAPESSHAYFDTHAVYIGNEYGYEIKDFVVSQIQPVTSLIDALDDPW